MIASDEVVRAATGVSAARGLEAVTVERLSEDLGVPEREFSERFGSDELLQQSIVWAGAAGSKEGRKRACRRSPGQHLTAQRPSRTWVDYAE